MENKTQWYDGWFYDKFVASSQDIMFEEIKKLIGPDASILDLGCGTGRFAFSVAPMCKSVLGIDISKKNIERAKRNLFKNENDKIKFRHSSLSKLMVEGQHFDYAVMTFMIHEISENERLEILQQLSQVADKIIIGDYLVPRPKNFKNRTSRIIEYLAGKKHFHNFLNFIDNGGIESLAEKAGLKIVTEIKNIRLASHIVLLIK